MSQANDDDTTIATLPPQAERPYPADPDAALALIKIGRHLEAVDEKLSRMFSTPDGPTFLPSVEQLVEDLVELLNMDLLDPDLEVGGDDEEAGDAEPSLGSFDQMPNQSKSWRQTEGSGWTTDAEQDNADAEPSLAALHHQINQENWSGGGTDEGEGDEHDGSEPDAEGEPDLGSFDRMTDQRKSWRQHNGPSTGWAVPDGEAGVDLPTADVDRRREAYQQKQKLPYNASDGITIPVRR